MCPNKVETTEDISSITHSVEIKMSKTETSETFEKSLETFANVAKMLIRTDEFVKNVPLSLMTKECRKIGLRSLLNQIRFESIDFLMREVSPDTRKEIMDCALEYDDEFDGSHISDGKYIRDWFHSETGKQNS